MGTPLRVYFLASEADPLIKVGGLGDVAGSLPLALQSIDPDVDVRLAIPFYKTLQEQALPLHHLATYSIPYTGGSILTEVFETQLDGLTVYLIAGDPITQDELIYHPQASADGLKFIFFSLAALEIPRILGWQPDIIHANDWHTAPAIYALKQKPHQRPALRDTMTVLGVHNLPYLGLGAGSALTAFGIKPARNPALPEWAWDAPLALGLSTADHIVAPSPNYALEILTPEFGSGLHEFLQKRAEHISGILNGIDPHRWNPATDAALISNYSSNELERRGANKIALQSELGLSPDSSTPLIAMVSRIDPQKGVDLVPEALQSLQDLGWQAVFLGSGSPALEAQLSDLQASYPERVRAILRFDADLGRRIYAAADIVLIPSRYEPCGLVQMIAMRYGAVPLAHATGGLRDTIRDFCDFGEGTGFLFLKPTAEALTAALARALGIYQKPALWREMQRRGMQKDFSWQSSACKYLTLYRHLVSPAAHESGGVK